MRGFQSGTTGGGGTTGNATDVWQTMASSRQMTINLQVSMTLWERSGAASGMDFMSYIQMMGMCDPLVLDLDGKGINLTSAEDGVLFDIKGDGSPVRTAFIKGEDAFLYLDANGNGLADDVSELFGDFGGYANGFDKLSRYDDNGDGVIDENDAVYQNLRVWRDRNSDGVNQKEESMTLAEAGISSISLNYDPTRELDAHGNVLGERSTFTRIDGSQGMIADVWLRNLQ